MADKLTDLPSLTDPVDTDVVYIVNVDADTSHQVTMANLFGSRSVGDLSDVSLAGIEDKGVLSWDGAQFTASISPDFKQVYNGSGGTIAAGTLVHITGTAGALPSVTVADKDTDTAVSGITIASLSAATSGLMQVTGTLQEAFVNTAGMAPGAPLYLGDAGAYTDARPTTGNAIQVGVVGVAAPSTGSILLDCPASAVAEADVTQHEAALTITKAQISDFLDADYATGAEGDLAASAVQPGDNVSTLTNDSGYITGYTVTQGDVTQHEAALTITESQISDLGTYVETADIGSTVQGYRAALTSAPASDPSGVTGASAITNVMTLTQSEYDAIGTPDSSTLYLIEE